MENLLNCINNEIYKTLNNIDRLDYHSPIDVDRHDLDRSRQQKYLLLLKSTREQLENHILDN